MGVTRAWALTGTAVRGEASVETLDRTGGRTFGSSENKAAADVWSENVLPRLLSLIK